MELTRTNKLVIAVATAFLTLSYCAGNFHKAAEAGAKEWGRVGQEQAAAKADRKRIAELPPIDNNDLRTVFGRMDAGDSRIFYFKEIEAGVYIYSVDKACKVNSQSNTLRGSIGAREVEGYKSYVMKAGDYAFARACMVFNQDGEADGRDQILVYDRKNGDYVIKTNMESIRGGIKRAEILN